MNIKGLRAFRLVAERGSIAAAAEVLNLSQPAVSRLISMIEDETGLNLFSRSRRKLTVTPEGQAFFRESEYILAGFDEIPRIAERIRTKSHESFRLVTAPRIGQGVAAPALGKMLQENPLLRCRVDIHGRRELEERVGTQHYDLGLVSLPVSHAHIATENRPLFSVRMEALMPLQHPLAAKSFLTADDLVDELLLSLHPELPWRQQVDDFFRSGGVKVTHQLETGSSLMACQLAGNGLGVTILDRVCAQAIDTSRIAIRPLEPARYISFGYIFRHDQPLSATAKLFLDCVRQVIEEFRDLSPENAAAVEPLWTDD